MKLRDAGLMVGAGMFALSMLTSNFTIGMPSPNFSGCLTHSLFLVSKFDTEIHRGGIYAITVPKDTLASKKGDKLIKFVAAIGGDKVRVAENGVWVNEREFFPVPLHGIAGRLGLEVSPLMKTTTVPAGQLYVVGNTDRSYDSRFWGTIDAENLIGRAVVLW